MPILIRKVFCAAAGILAIPYICMASPPYDINISTVQVARNAATGDLTGAWLGAQGNPGWGCWPAVAYISNDNLDTFSASYTMALHAKARDAQIRVSVNQIPWSGPWGGGGVICEVTELKYLPSSQ